MINMKNRLAFSEGFFYYSKGRSGGLDLLWNDNIQLEIMSASLHQSDCKISELFSDDKWGLSCFYG